MFVKRTYKSDKAEASSLSIETTWEEVVSIIAIVFLVRMIIYFWS